MWGNASGTAYFDNISIQKQAYPSTGTDRVKIERANVSAYIKKDIVDSIGYSAYSNWIDDVQKVYESYKELTGSYPYNGDKLILIDTDEPMIQQYGAIANFNPLLFNGKQAENFEDYAKNDCMNFGVLHEIGHAFDKKKDNSGDYEWNFHAEFWTNTKMFYVLDDTDVDARIDNTKAADRQQMGEFYKKISNGGYNNFQKAGEFSDDYYDALSYIFVKIVDEIGWEPFKKTFRQYVAGDVKTLNTTFGKFKVFLDILQENYNPNGTEVMDCIGEKDFNIIRNGMPGGDKYVVVFKDTDGEVLKLEQVAKGADATPPSDPTMDGYFFDGWSGSYTNVTNDIVLTAEYTDKNLTTIYYKGYENPYIHYQIGNGTWTSVPGVKMEANSDVDGYNYAITIDLGAATSLTACFNDGNNNWDSNDSNNYVFGAGYYTYSNKKITKIEKPSSELKIKSITSSSGDTMSYGSSSDITINAAGGQGPYTYTMRYSLYGSGRDRYLLNGSKTNTATFTPDYPRETTLHVTVTDAAGTTVTAQKVIDVKEVSQNQVTIYYKGYNNPNIHYKIGNGDWTNVPGVQMGTSTKVSGYPYAITIDLGDATSLTACFNDGNGNWDSNNSNNYTFGVREYTYSNGSITKIN